MARLLSVNVGLPRDIEWRGRTVRTGIWKEPVGGRRRVTRLNVDGDGQGDLGGHGGEQRAVFVYQTDSYRYWEGRLGRGDLVPGQFGENFTVEGLLDAEVCVGDRYRIGTALFEVTQPRTTCYRVGIRLNEPRMAALLTSSDRPGFYFRVLEEGDVSAGDDIHLVAGDPERMTIAEINALLYSSSHPRNALERALRIPALSPGWRSSFAELRRSQETHPGASGNPGLVAGAGESTARPGFHQLRVLRIDSESDDVISLSLEPASGAGLQKPLAGQFVVLRLRPQPGDPPIFRSYSLSGPLSEARYRISVRIEPDGAGGRYLRTLHAGDVLDVSEPRGSFTLRPGDGPVVFLSGGIGATPVLAMLHALATEASTREVWWLHVARSGPTHAFAAEAHQLLDGLAHAHRRIWYSRPGAEDRLGRDYDAPGRLAADDLRELGVPCEADFYLCGPASFIADLTTGLEAWGVAADRMHTEAFAGGPSLTPGIAAGAAPAPHQPTGAPGTGPLVSFARSGLTVRWRTSAELNLLELAEACDVPVRWSCRTGVCHNCESGLVSGSVEYDPDPLDPPADGHILICCSRPRGDVVIDM